MAERTRFDAPSLAELIAANRRQQLDVQPAIANFTAQQQLVQGAGEANLRAKLEQARQQALGLQNQQEAEQFKQKLGLQEQELDLKRQALGQEKELALAKTKDDTKKGKILPAPQAETIGEFRGLVSEASNVRSLFDKSLVNGDSPFVGPADARIQGAKQFVEGKASPEAAQFKAGLASIRNRLLNLLSGAAISPAEYKRLSDQLPDETKSETDFKEKLSAFQRVYSEIEQEKIGAFRQAGFDVAGFGQPQPTQTGNDVPAVGGTFQGGRVTKVTRIQ